MDQSSNLIQVVLPENICNGKISISSGKSVLFVGANGSGKTRLAGYLNLKNENSWYIPASRQVRMPNTYSVTTQKKEMETIVGGHDGMPGQSLEKIKRLRYSLDTAFHADDFSNVINVVGSRHASSSIQFSQSYNPKSPPKAKQQSDLDRAAEIWRKCLPHLEIHTEVAAELSVSRKSDPKNRFAPEELSDGERVIFYLVAKVVIAPPKSIIIVDEPESFIHRAVRSQLWDALEAARNDCVFIYFTHDVDFSATRNFEYKFAVKSFTIVPEVVAKRVSGKWEILEFHSDGNIPEETQLAILGSRRPVLIVEGETQSLDLTIAQIFYPDFYIESRGSCSAVTRDVKALSANSQFHHIKIFGLVDRDGRSQSECDLLKKSNICVHPLREIENIFATSSAVRAFLENTGRTNEVATTIALIVSELQKKLTHKLETKVEKATKYEVLKVVEKSMGAPNLQEFQKLVKEIDIDAIRTTASKVRSSVITSGNLDEMLKYFSVRKDDFKELIGLPPEKWSSLK
jgi:energy-coupling factor transporter ATP-binding protein EcfA2